MCSLNGINAVIAGHVCLDIIPEFGHFSTPEQVLIPGRLSEVGKSTFAAGGVAANTGISLLKLGVPATIIGKVGSDGAGEQIVSALNQSYEQSGRNLIVSAGEASSYSIVLNFPGLDRLFLHHPGTNNTFCAADLPIDNVKQATLFHFGYPPLMKEMYRDNGSELVHLFQVLKEEKVITSLDMAMPDPNGESGTVNWRSVLQNVLPHVDFFMPSLEEIMFMLYPETWREQLNQVTEALVRSVGEELLQMGCRLVMIKLGENGLYMRTGKWPSVSEVTNHIAPQWSKREIWAACFKVDVQGTTGAGDSTIAGFLASFLRGNPPETAMLHAVAAGACCIEKPDATSGIPDWEQLNERMKGSWAVKPPSISLKGWEPHGHQLWIGPNDTMLLPNKEGMGHHDTSRTNQFTTHKD